VGSSVWVANSGDGTVSQLDSRRLKVIRTVGIGAEATDIATGAGGVWVATGNDNTLVQIDPRTGAVLETLRLPREEIQPTTAPAVAVGEGAVWAASGFRLLKIDPASSKIVAGLRGMKCCGGLADIALGLGAVWVADLTEVVARVSPRTSTPTGPPVRGPYPSSLAVGYGSVWVAGADEGGTHPALWRIDAQTLQVTQTIPLGKRRLPGPALGLATGDGAVWLADYDRGTLLRIDPATGAIVSTIRIGGHPWGVAVGAGRVWVTVD
jgi:DNA-binding beta-propeller fold protein YncE